MYKQEVAIKREQLPILIELFMTGFVLGAPTSDQVQKAIKEATGKLNSDWYHLLTMATEDLRKALKQAAASLKLDEQLQPELYEIGAGFCMDYGNSISLTIEPLSPSTDIELSIEVDQRCYEQIKAKQPLSARVLCGLYAMTSNAFLGLAVSNLLKGEDGTE